MRLFIFWDYEPITCAAEGLTEGAWPRNSIHKYKYNPFSRPRNILKKEYKKSLPILLKIDPDINDRLLKDLVDITIRKKLNGIIATNTTIDKSVIKKSLQNIPDGGISGKLLYKKSNKTLKKVNKFSKGKLQVIGLGGVDNGDSAYQKIKLGASGIQIYSGLVFKGPDLIESILSDLLIILKKNKK